MPIKGLTNRKLSFPEIGQIRKGAPKGDKGQLGKDLTYFRVEFDEEETKAAAVFNKVYGSEPNEINILIPFNDIGQVFDAYLEAYTAGRMVARSDGEKFEYLIDTKTGEVIVKNGLPYTPYTEGMSVGSYQDQKGNEVQITCKTVGRLKVVIPELQRLAYMTVMTSSKHDISNLDAQLNALKQVNENIIAGIPMVLRRRPKKISTPKADGTRARYTKWMLSIEADPEWVKHKLTAIKTLALPGNGLDLLPEIIVPEEDPIEEGQFTEPTEETTEDESDPRQDTEAQFYKEADEGYSAVKVEETPGERERVDVTNLPGRPYTAEVIRAKVRQLAQNAFLDKKIVEKRKERIGLLVGMIEECFAGAGDASAKRHELCWYLTGVGSSKTMPDNYILAMLNWIAAKKDDGNAWHPGEHVAAEAQSILVARLKSLGQGELL